MNTYAISDVRTNLPAIVNRVNKYLDRVFITVNGKTKAAVISIEELESLEETAEILAISGARKSIRQGMKEIKQGKYTLLKDILAKYP